MNMLSQSRTPNILDTLSNYQPFYGLQSLLHVRIVACSASSDPSRRSLLLPIYTLLLPSCVLNWPVHTEYPSN
jgi:hypothetical protein